jgi:hypothetical protein
MCASSGGKTTSRSGTTGVRGTAQRTTTMKLEREIALLVLVKRRIWTLRVLDEGRRWRPCNSVEELQRKRYLKHPSTAGQHARYV